MEPPRYDGTIHPQRWIEKVELYCKLNQITDVDDILEMSILLIDTPLTDKDTINDTDELIETLKQEPHFTVFKNQAKRKLSCLLYDSYEYIEDENEPDRHVKFMKEFLSLCYDAEVLEEINEVKRYLFQALN